jgi:hypothetical protein
VENGVWMKNGEEMQLANSAKYHVTMNDAKESALVVSLLDATDEGAYTFSIENRCGRGESNPVSFKIPNGKKQYS